MMNSVTDKAEQMANQIEGGVAKVADHIGDKGRGIIGAIHDSDLSNEIQKLQGQINDIGRKVQHSAEKVDSHIHTHPYLYLAGAFGVGFLAAQIITVGKTRRISH